MTISDYKKRILDLWALCLVSNFIGPGKFSMFFSIIVQASTSNLNKNSAEWYIHSTQIWFSILTYELWFQIINTLWFPKNILGNWLQCNSGVATLKLRSNFFWQKSIYRSGKCQLFPSEMQEKSSSTLKILTFDCCIILSQGRDHR